MNIVSGLLQPADQATPAVGGDQPQPAAKRAPRRARAAPTGRSQGAGSSTTGGGGQGSAGPVDLSALLEQARRGCASGADANSDQNTD